MENKLNSPNILIVDDEIGPRESLRMILKPYYNVFTVESGHAAIQMIQQNEFDVITLDLKMPGMSGIDTLKEIRKYDSNVIVIIITGYGTLQSAIESIRHGVFDYFPKPFNVTEIMSIIEKSIQRRRLNVKIKGLLKSTVDQQLAQETMIHSEILPKPERDIISHPQWDHKGYFDNQAGLEFAKVLANTLEEKDPYTSGHSERVCYYSNFISKRLALSPQDQKGVQIASYLHDIGKIGISNRFINKKGALTPTDWAMIKQHSQKSIELLAPLKLPSSILAMIQHHHEHFDGTGYPDGLIGDQIPVGARIITVADSYESMTSDRPYRRPLSKEGARNELIRCSGKQFDPHFVTVFLSILNEIEETYLIREFPKVSSMSY